MGNLGAFNAEVFNTLNESRMAFLASENQAHLAGLGEIILRHGLEKELGIMFLHKHFDIEGDERLVEEIYENKIVIKPRAVSSDDDVCPYVWKLSREQDGSTCWRPLEYVSGCSGAVAHYECFSRNDALREEIGHYLVSSGMDYLFGVVSRHREIILEEENSMLLEETDRVNRTLSIEPVQDIRPRDDVVDTVWHFEKASNGRVIVGCRNSCSYSGGHH